jgi:poly(beta-D-mannuronate) lyase
MLAVKPRALAFLLAIGCGDADQGDGTTVATTTTSTSGESTAVDPSTTADATADSTSAEDTAAASSEASSSSSDTRGTDGSESGTPATLPAELLDLGAWKLTLPVGSDDEPDAPREVLQPELATFAMDPYFVLGPDGDRVVFHAHAGGVTTDNSGYPRSELREMTKGGADEAAWSTTSGVHSMTITQAITHLPEAKAHVVAGQIHDAEDDVVMIRLEDAHLFVEGGGEELATLDESYALGTIFTVRLSAHDGVIEVFYEDLDTPALTLDRATDGCYFKAGVYTQSNEAQGDAPTAYGEVEILELDVTHE